MRKDFEHYRIIWGVIMSKKNKDIEVEIPANRERLAEMYRHAKFMWKIAENEVEKLKEEVDILMAKTDKVDILAVENSNLRSDLEKAKKLVKYKLFYDAYVSYQHDVQNKQIPDVETATDGFLKKRDEQMAKFSQR